jgi:phosphate transport system permease protein
MSLYARRRVTNTVALSLSLAAAAFGLFWLVAILWTLFYNGFTALSLDLFTQNTPPPGDAGGLLNAIFGSLIMTVIATLVGAPVGIMAGTWLAEYGRGTRLAEVIRFINDILLSAPSIVVGLFVYVLLVMTMGHFSAWAGAVALAVIVVPVVVRTTEDMLNLVPAGRGARRAAMEGHHSGGLSRGPQRHAYRRAAGGGAHQRRDRAAAVHRAEQSVLEYGHERADGQPAGGDLPVRAQPL